MRRWILGALVLGCGLPAVASAHDEAKTPVSGSIILEMTKPSAPARDRAFDESLRRDGPPPANQKPEPVVQPDGTIRYGNSTIIIRHDCPPGGDFFEPPPRPGRRR
ncbi:MAG TPA: hypothetical protein VN646_20295 [Candidatus Acidoferrum sp.]|jgi:hypothetical protein|nr:hypothetical protein [Candidatus Acidoferrum sp.]